MIVLGLTGSIGMGKSTTAALLRQRGIAVFDADATVHRLLAGAAVPLIAESFPDSVVAGAVNRRILGALVFGQPERLRRLEAILHPLVRGAERRFLAAQARARKNLVVLDVPLLLETGGQSRCDWVVVVSAPGFLQRQRVLARQGMSAARFEEILRQQMPDRVKCRLADTVLPTGLGRRVTLSHLDRMLRFLIRHPPPRPAWNPHA